MDDAGHAPSTVHWAEDGETRSALWHSDRGLPAPKRIVIADDRLRADDAYAAACQGTALLWRGDFQNARQLLKALAVRAERKPRGRPRAGDARAGDARAGDAGMGDPRTSGSPADAFHRERQLRAQRARTLGMLLIPLDADYGIPLRRAPDLREACTEAWGPPDGASLVPLRALLGVIGAHQWRKRGIEIPAPGGRIHPHYGVFAPVRHEYVDLVARAPLPGDAARLTAFDVGTGTGVLAAVLARRGVARVLATDLNPRALACARENLERLGLAQHVELLAADLFPPGRAGLVVCNPPWLPARPGSPLEEAVYDPGSRMLLGFLAGLAAHLEPAGEGWLILSDLAEHLGLRSREVLLEAIEAGGLKVLGRLDARPSHPRASDPSDPLHAARRAETTSLWRLAAR